MKVIALPITPKVAREALHHFCPEEGIDPGYFFTKFYELLGHADDETLDKLSTVFPSQVGAFLLGRKPEGLAILRITASFPMSVNPR